MELRRGPMNTNAVVIVHWPGKSMPMCRKHADQAARIADAMGMPRATETPCPAQKCKNCSNEKPQLMEQGIRQPGRGE